MDVYSGKTRDGLCKVRSLMHARVVQLVPYLPEVDGLRIKFTRVFFSPLIILDFASVSCAVDSLCLCVCVQAIGVFVVVSPHV